MAEQRVGTENRRWTRPGLCRRAAAVWLACTVAAAALAGWLPLQPPDQIDWRHVAAAPGVAGHLLGTDNMGRDIASRLLFGARVSLTVGFFAPGIGLLIGTVGGVAAGFYRGAVDRVITGVIDTFMAFPRLIFLLMVMFVFGANTLNLTLALGFVCVPSFARITRANTIRLTGREFTLAARAAGASDRWIILREILPNLAPPMLAYLMAAMAVVMMAEVALGFLGLSVPAPTPTWGGMIGEGREVLDQAPHVTMIPSLAIFLTILSLNLLGDSLRSFRDSRESQL